VCVSVVTGERGGLVVFPCRLFDTDYHYSYSYDDDVGDDDGLPTVAVGYCFRLVSVATDGAVTRHLERCLPLTDSQHGQYNSRMRYIHKYIRNF